MGLNPIGSRLAASQHSSFGKRQSSSLSTPSTSAKKLRQTNLSRFLTPRTQNNPITPPATVIKPLQPNGNAYQNPSISISDAQDISTLPDGLVLSKMVIGDGNCLLRAICLTHSGSQSGHSELRQQAIGYIRSHPLVFIQDITFLCQCSLEDYCARISQNGVFGDDVLLMACCILLSVNVQLYTLNSHLQDGRRIENLSRCTFSPLQGSSDTIHLHLDTGDSEQVRQCGMVVGTRQTRTPHYDTVAMALRTPLSDITNRSTKPTRMPVSALNSFPNIQKLMLDDDLDGPSYDASHRDFIQDFGRIVSGENSDSETNGADVSYVSTVVNDSSRAL